MVKINRRFFLQGTIATATLGLVKGGYDIEAVFKSALPAEGYELQHPDALIKAVFFGLRDAAFQLAENTPLALNALRQDPENIFSTKEAPDYLDVVSRIEEPEADDFASFYRRFCERSSVIKLFDLLCPEDGNMLSLDEKKHIALITWQLGSCIAGPIEGEIEFETAKYILLMENLQDKTWRKNTWQALRAEYIRLSRTAEGATNAMPRFSIWLHEMVFSTDQKYVGLHDPEFAREMHFFKKYGFWTGDYTQGPNLEVLRELQESYLGRYIEYTYSQKQKLGIASEPDVTCDDFESLQEGIRALRIFEDEILFADAMQLRNAKNVLELLRQMPRYQYKKLVVDYTVYPENTNDEPLLEPRAHASHYSVDLKFNDKGKLQGELKAIFGNCEKRDGGYRVIVPMVAGDDALDRLQSWRKDSMIMRRQFSTAPK